MAVISDLLRSLDLVVVAGPDEGSRFRLEGPGPIPVGRSARGVRLRDALVNIHHAEITLRKDGAWQIRDLGSMTGTRVGGQPVPPGEERVLALGDEIEVGESTLVVERRHQRALLLALANVIVLVAVAMSTLLALTRDHSDPGAPLTWHEPIRQGSHAHPELALFRPFLRQRGLDPTKLRLRRVTDLDRNGVDEVWLQDGPATRVVTFDGQGQWQEIGLLPSGCTDTGRTGEKIGLGFPPLRCPARDYEFVDGQYVVSRQKGAVVWFRESSSEGDRLTVRLVSVGRPERVAGFLGARGVAEPVAWVLCDDAFPELLGQAGTEAGLVRALGRPCGEGITYQSGAEAPAEPGAGGTPAVDVPSVDILGVAFTHSGRESLLGALKRYYGGNVEGSLFLPPTQAELLARWEAEPEPGQGLLQFHATDQFFQPFAREGTSLRDVILHHREESAPSAPVLTATLLSPGVARVDPPGCASLELQAGDWTCQLSGGCMGMLTFLTVRDVGCDGGSTLLTLPYDGGVAEASLPGLQIRARVRSSQGHDGLEVRHAQVSYRIQDPE